MTILAIHHRVQRSAALLLLAMVAIAVGMAPSCTTSKRLTCSGDLHEHKGKCLTMTEIQYLDCIDGFGFSTAFEIGGGFEAIADRSLNLAYKKSRQEDTPVALQIVQHCFQLAGQQAQSISDRAVAQSHASDAAKKAADMPVGDCQADKLDASITEVSPMNFELTVTGNTSAPCTLREPLDMVKGDTQKPLGSLPSNTGGDITLQPGQSKSVGTFGWSQGVCPYGLRIDFTPAGANSAFQATMPANECSSDGGSSSSSSDSGTPSS